MIHNTPDPARSDAVQPDANGRRAAALQELAADAADYLPDMLAAFQMAADVTEAYLALRARWVAIVEDETRPKFEAAMLPAPYEALEDMHQEILEVVDFRGIGADAEHDVANSRRIVAEIADHHAVDVTVEVRTGPLPVSPSPVVPPTASGPLERIAPVATIDEMRNATLDVLALYPALVPALTNAQAVLDQYGTEIVDHNLTNDEFNDAMDHSVVGELMDVVHLVAAMADGGNLSASAEAKIRGRYLDQPNAMRLAPARDAYVSADRFEAVVAQRDRLIEILAQVEDAASLAHR